MENAVPTCHWHPDTPAGVICQRCDRPICPKCMHQASVGFHCPDCARTGKQKVIRGIPHDKPVVTIALIAINVAVFLLGVILDGGDALQGSSGRLQEKGALIAKFIVVQPNEAWALHGVGEGEWYRIFTAGFLHYGIIHLGMNMLVLYMLGQLLEPVGKGRFLLIYFASMATGALGALVLSPDSLTAGASGAIFGMMGAVFMGHRSMGVDWRNSPLLGTIVLNLVLTMGLSHMISVGGHVGGLIGGVVSGWIVFDLGRRRNLPQWLPYVLVGALLVIASIAAIVYATSWDYGAVPPVLAAS